jgi:hypothetical protein
VLGLYSSRYLSTILLPRSTIVDFIWAPTMCSVQLYRRMNDLDLDRLYNWTAENGLCLNPEKSQAIVISFPGEQPVSMGSATIPFCTRVKSLGLTINRRFGWDDQCFFDSGWYAVTIGSVTCCAIVSLL